MTSGNIKISYSELSTKIEELRSMRREWNSSSIKKEKPEMVGDGKTVNICDQIADEYLELYDTVCTLLSQTISFLNKVNKSVSKADKNAAKAIESSGSK